NELNSPLQSATARPVAAGRRRAWPSGGPPTPPNSQLPGAESHWQPVNQEARGIGGTAVGPLRSDPGQGSNLPPLRRGLPRAGLGLRTGPAEGLFDGKGNPYDPELSGVGRIARAHHLMVYNQVSANDLLD